MNTQATWNKKIRVEKNRGKFCVSLITTTEKNNLHKKNDLTLSEEKSFVFSFVKKWYIFSPLFILELTFGKVYYLY